MTQGWQSLSSHYFLLNHNVIQFPFSLSCQAVWNSGNHGSHTGNNSLGWGSRSTRMRDVWAIVGLSGNVGDFWGTDTLQAGLETGGTSIHPRALPLDVATFLCGAQPNLAQPVDFVDFPITDRRRQLTPVAPREQGHILPLASQQSERTVDFGQQTATHIFSLTNSCQSSFIIFCICIIGQQTASWTGARVHLIQYHIFETSPCLPPSWPGYKADSQPQASNDLDTERSTILGSRLYCGPSVALFTTNFLSHYSILLPAARNSRLRDSFSYDAINAVSLVGNHIGSSRLNQRHRFCSWNYTILRPLLQYVRWKYGDPCVIRIASRALPKGPVISRCAHIFLPRRGVLCKTSS